MYPRIGIRPIIDGRQFGIRESLVGGGAKDGLLCKMTANACNCTVAAGPVEATAFGNIAMQLIASGDVADLKAARRIIAASGSVKTFEPDSPDEWEQACERFVRFTADS